MAKDMKYSIENYGSYLPCAFCGKVFTPSETLKEHLRCCTPNRSKSQMGMSNPQVVSQSFYPTRIQSSKHSLVVFVTTLLTCFQTCKLICSTTIVQSMPTILHNLQSLQNTPACIQDMNTFAKLSPVYSYFLVIFAT